MEINVTSNKENKLLNRREIDFYVIQDGSTPSNKDIKTELCKKLNLDPEAVMVVSIDQTTGLRQSHCTAHAYPSKEQVEKFEPAHLINRMKGIKGKAPAAKKEATPAKKPEEAKKAEQKK
jgi:small subunit ribosomal protein S24e